MLVRRLDVDLQRGAGPEQDLRAEQRGRGGTGDVEPSSDPRNTRAAQPSPVTSGGA